MQRRAPPEARSHQVRRIMSTDRAQQHRLQHEAPVVGRRCVSAKQVGEPGGRVVAATRCRRRPARRRRCRRCCTSAGAMPWHSTASYSRPSMRAVCCTSCGVLSSDRLGRMCATCAPSSTAARRNNAASRVVGLAQQAEVLASQQRLRRAGLRGALQRAGVGQHGAHVAWRHLVEGHRGLRCFWTGESSAWFVQDTALHGQASLATRPARRLDARQGEVAGALC